MSNLKTTKVHDSSGCVFYDLNVPCEKDACNVCESKTTADETLRYFGELAKQDHELLQSEINRLRTALQEIADACSWRPEENCNNANWSRRRAIEALS